MMETKLWFALCALLVINLGSAKHDNNQTDSTTSTLNTEAAPTVHLGASSLNLTDQPSPAPDHLNTNTSRNDTSSLSSNMTTDTNTVTPSLGDNNRNLTNNLTTQPPVQATPTSPPHVTHAAPSNTTNTTLSTNTSTSVPPKTHSSTSAPAPEPPKTHHSNATVSTKSTSTSSTGSSQEHASTETHTVTAPHTPQAEQTKSTVSPSAQAKAHVNTPSQLNVGGGTTMVHESPTLDPLLAGLVSAFIVTAVIITLLLFLKLRRRDNRPEFRRLQDLPMDDMMEDTPLSMYTY